MESFQTGGGGGGGIDSPRGDFCMYVYAGPQKVTGTELLFSTRCTHLFVHAWSGCDAFPQHWESLSCWKS